MDDFETKERAEPARRAIAEALVKESDPSKVVAYFCTHCGTVYKTKEDAERCTRRKCTDWVCEDCGKEAGAYQWYCYSCMDKRRLERVVELMGNAPVVIPWKDYPEDQGIVFDSEYYPCIDDFLEHCEMRGLDVPKRVWATNPSFFKIDPNIIEELFYDWADGCEDIDKMEMVGEIGLRMAIEDFNKEQTACIYFESSTAVVDLENINDSEDL